MKIGDKVNIEVEITDKTKSDPLATYKIEAYGQEFWVYGKSFKLINSDLEKAEAIRKQGYWYSEDGKKKVWHSTHIGVQGIFIHAEGNWARSIDKCNLELPKKEEHEEVDFYSFDSDVFDKDQQTSLRLFSIEVFKQLGELKELIRNGK